MPGKIPTHKSLLHQERNLGRRIRSASKARNRKGLHEANRSYMESYAAKYKAALKVLCAKKGSRGSGGKKFAVTANDKRRSLELASQVNVWEPCDEKVILNPKEKLNGFFEFRFIFSFGEENQLRQILVKNALLHRFNMMPEQYLMTGGRDKAVKAVQKNYKEGYRYTIELDVYHAFQSFDVLGVAKHLSLPKEVCLNVLSGVNLNVSLSNRYRGILHYAHSDKMSPMALFSELESDWQGAWQGLTEGSRVSPFVSEMMLSWVVDRLSLDKGRLVNYADNFLFMCKCELDTRELASELRELLWRHPAGPLNVKWPQPVIEPGNPFEFLGYTVTSIDNTASISWNDRVRKKTKAQRKCVYDLLGSSVSIERKIKAINSLFVRQRSIYAGFQLWEGGKTEFKAKMRQIVGRAVAVGVPHDQLPVSLLKFINQDLPCPH